MGDSRHTVWRLADIRAAAVGFCWLAALSGILYAQPNVPATKPSEPHRQILYLNSYHVGYSWSDSILAGIQAVLQPAEDYDLYVEFMDTKRHNDPEDLLALARRCERRYGPLSLDVVICSDDNALDFALAQRARLFPNTPIVFCGINNLTDAGIAGHDNLTGVSEQIDIVSTLEAALALHPECKTVAVVSDDTTTGRANLAAFEGVAEQFSDRVRFTRLTEVTTSQALAQQLKVLPADAVILYLSWVRDEFGDTYSAEQGVRFIADHANVPVYGMWGYMLNRGAVGGKLVLGEAQGRAAAEKALQIIAGTPADEIPILRESPNEYVFDYALLRHFGAHLSALPPGSQLINLPSGFYYRYWPWIWAATAAIFLETALIAALLVNRARRRRAERALHESETRAELAVSALDLATWDWDVRSGKLTRDASWAKLLGYATGEIADTLTAWERLLHPDDQAAAMAALQEHLAGGAPLYEAEYRLRTKTGEYRWMLDRGRVVERGAAGEALRVIGIHQDIHARKRASQALEASERRYRTHFALARVGLAITSLEKGWIEVNDRLCEILGYSAADLKQRTWADVTYPPDLAADVAEFDRLLRGEADHYSMEKRFVRRDGALVYAFISAIAIRRADRSIDHFVGLVHDITESKRTEQALRRSEDQLRRALEAANEAIWEWDVVTDEAYLSPAWFRMLGYAPDGLPQRWETWQQSLHAEDREQTARRLRSAVRRGDGAFSVEARVVTAAGEVRWMLCRGKVDRRDPKGDPIRVIGSQTDITDLKRAEEAARGSEQRLRSILDSMPDVVLQLDRDLSVQWANRAATKMGDATLGRRCHEVFHGGEEVCEACPAVRCMERGQVVTATVSHENLGPRRLHWEDVCVPLRNGGSEVIGALVIARDITERVEAEERRRQLEQQIQQAQKLESLGVLAGGIAHDFNNLLVGILGNVDLAVDELPAASPARARLSGVETAAKRAADLTRQMLAYSGKGKFVIEPIDLNGLVGEMSHLLDVSISKRVVLRCDFADNLPAVEGDVTQLRQVVMNLITNASEAIGDRSGVISLSTGATEYNEDYLATMELNEALPPGLYIYLEVADTGVGMDAETQKRIFDPFFTTKFTGRGLGLAAVLGIVRGHHGAIKVYSEPGRGTTFKVILPASEKVVATASPGEADETWQAAGTVLLADDEETVRVVGKAMLERVGLDVLVAEDGRQALDLAKAHVGDLKCIVLDLTMPHLDGEETFRQLRQAGIDVPVILSSGYNEQEVSQRFVGKGLAGFVQKPYKRQTLLAAIRRATNGHGSDA